MKTTKYAGLLAAGAVLLPLLIAGCGKQPDVPTAQKQSEYKDSKKDK